MIDTFNKPLFYLFLVIPALIFGISWTVSEAQTYIEPVCDLPFNVDYTIDVTELMLRGHNATYQSDTWWQVRAEWVEIYGGGRLNYGTFNILGHWAVVFITGNGEVSVVMGENWTIGTDNQLHNPYCSEILPINTIRFFDKFPQCHYPTRCE